MADVANRLGLAKAKLALMDARGVAPDAPERQQLELVVAQLAGELSPPDHHEPTQEEDW